VKRVADDILLVTYRAADDCNCTARRERDWRQHGDVELSGWRLSATHHLLDSQRRSTVSFINRYCWRCCASSFTVRHVFIKNKG